jgi:hypothetical protein
MPSPQENFSSRIARSTKGVTVRAIHVRRGFTRSCAAIGGGRLGRPQRSLAACATCVQHFAVFLLCCVLTLRHQKKERDAQRVSLQRKDRLCIVIDMRNEIVPTQVHGLTSPRNLKVEARLQCYVERTSRASSRTSTTASAHTSRILVMPARRVRLQAHRYRREPHKSTRLVRTRGYYGEKYIHLDLSAPSTARCTHRTAYTAHTMHYDHRV